MPARRSTFKRRPYRRPYRSYAKRAPKLSSADMAWQLAQRAWKQGKWLKTMINAEKKFVDLTFNNNPDATNGTVNFVNDVPVGDGPEARDGMQCRIKSLSVKGVVQLHASASQTYVRILAVQWYGNVNVVTPVLADVLSDVNVNGHYSKTHAGLYKILKDFVIIVDDNRPLKTFRFFIPMNCITRWTESDTSGDENACTKNGLFFMALSSEATNTPAVNIISRIMFYDN